MTHDYYDSFHEEEGRKKSSHTTSHPTLPHYYGDIVRKLFLAAGIILLVTLPFLHQRFSLPELPAIILILILTFSAGITNPLQKWVAFGDTLISVFGFALFAYDAIIKFERVFDLLFLTNLTLAGIFLFAFYLGTKTTRSSSTYIPKAERFGAREKSENGSSDSSNSRSQTKKDDSEDVNAEHKLSQPLTEEERRRKRFLSE